MLMKVCMSVHFPMCQPSPFDAVVTHNDRLLHIVTKKRRDLCYEMSVMVAKRLNGEKSLEVVERIL
jgi:hypothetical protein